MNNFAWAAIMLFRISGASQAYFGRFKGCYQRGYYCRERLYSQISLKVWDSKEKLAFSSRLPLRRHIAWLGTFSVDPGIVVSFYASTHHQYTTLAIDEWMIFWLSEDSPVEVGSTECSHHLVFESFLHVRLLPATLQYALDNTTSLLLVLMQSFANAVLTPNMWPKLKTQPTTQKVKFKVLLVGDTSIYAECIGS